VKTVAALALLLGLASCAKRAPEEVVSPTRFSSGDAPSLSLEAPPGWMLSYDRAEGKLLAAGPAVSLTIQTARLEGGVDRDSFVRQFAALAQTTNSTVERPFEEELDGIAASGVTFSNEQTSAAAWYVPRGGDLVTAIVCKGAPRTEARVSCRPVLSAIRWRTPL
jgi:hypothetical protein